MIYEIQKNSCHVVSKSTVSLWFLFIYDTELEN